MTLKPYYVLPELPVTVFSFDFLLINNLRFVMQLTRAFCTQQTMRNFDAFFCWFSILFSTMHHIAYVGFSEMSCIYFILSDNLLRMTVGIYPRIYGL